MTLDADLIVDRRRTRRRLVLWRASAFVLAAVIALGAVALIADRTGLAGGATPQIARISIGGVILEDPDLVEMIGEIADSEAVEGVILAIDSPGGSTTGGEALYVALRELAEKKPTAATVGTLAASAGYMVAIAGDHIVAHRTSITGSIGVYFQYGNVERLLDTLGVEVRTIKSAPLKAEPSPFGPEAPGAREAMAALVDDSYQWFVDIVAERRQLERPEALRLADGRVYSGRQALAVKLVDAIGGEDEAVAWLEEARDVSADLPVVDWTPEREDDGFSLFGYAAARIGALVGVDVGQLAAGQMPLAGLVSLWHPDLQAR
ncbi:signal peptide peptidase SppA [Methylobrevis pamukkalensis]|uniref:Putative signal peptide peptidase SppA n=1 Tax=Methylobrevis pamukkalensis TaxID=1439726 RepID=A0A1E3H3I9_9HYPH|nr:signal peptide peptidase SppA [Methylobrevis pamukkalensis]ODN70888.1 putative signal peptide peptidase SppA [Methylobrevis pamukkalensis]